MINKQNSHLTYKANLGIGRHDWLRLTPAYSVNLVQAELNNINPGAVVLDPFSGTGTTGLCAAEKGYNSILLDINPFLIWLAKTKTRNYGIYDIQDAQEKLEQVLTTATSVNPNKLWIPPIHNIERWWDPSTLLALARLRYGLDQCNITNPNTDLLTIAFCNTLIKESNASFNHQSMSFKQSIQAELFLKGSEMEVFNNYKAHAQKIIDSASVPLVGTVDVVESDSRAIALDCNVDVVITSPPYVNRMSYIRELRPYMYWLGYLNEAKEAGELDWKAIGGTWGTATSKLNKWTDIRALPIKTINEVTDKISQGDIRHGKLLSNYVRKYFYDMWEHFETVHKVLHTGGKVIYIVGNSSFYNNVVPAEQWYVELMQSVGFHDCNVEVIRKRNSNKALFEFSVTGKK